MQQELILSGSPHIKSGQSTSRIMLDVIIALIPACIAAVYFFGIGCIATMALCIASAVGCEAAIQYFTKRAVTISDLSAVVTGLLLALNLPPNVPWYLPVCGSAFAIIIVKQCFGGLGHNFMNPALAARCFLLISWPVAMTTFVAPFAGVDAVASATPLGVLHEGGTAIPPIMDMFMGEIGGSMGETSALALLIGGVYLLVRRVISLRIPLAYMGTVALITLLTGKPEMILFELFAGGLMLGAFFMATDYVSSPSSPKAQIVFGIGCGAITMIVRLWGGYPEGVSFSILFMNLLTPLLDKVLKPKVFGEVQKVNE
ncbi:electron transport complex subunit D [Christensenellaceae bacterium]|nr:electron transport complex subunit D [Christensenellaceae bacterium]BDF60364.1 electron transport complex subunit D [Christensenellaceae bacterium]